MAYSHGAAAPGSSDQSISRPDKRDESQGRNDTHINPGKNHFLSGVSILTLSALAVKVIGLLYRIPMLNTLGSEGMGYFNTAYEVYALLCVLSTAGLPVAMSVLIAGGGNTPGGQTPSHVGQPAHTRPLTVRRIFRVSLGLFICLGAVGSAALWILAEPLCSGLGNPQAAACLRAISPTVFLICLSGAFRGYFQGKRNMTPTAVSQVMEALGKLLLGLLFATWAKARGADLPTTAAWAVLGLTVGTAVSVLYLAVHKRLTDAGSCRLPALSASASETVPGRRRILRSLLATAVPVTISAGVISLTKCVDLALILRRMQDAGLSTGEANALYGTYSTLAVPVFNILPSLTTSVAMSAVPALSTALARQRASVHGPDTEADAELAGEEVRRTAVSALRMTLWLAIPAGLGLCVFSGDILSLLFRSQPEAAALATPWLRVLGLAVPASCLITVTGAMLQAAGHAGCPVVSMLIGTGCKTVLAYFLLGVPSLGLMGAPLSSLVCDTVILIVNGLFLTRYARDMLPAPGEAAALCLLPSALAVCSIWLSQTLVRHAGWHVSIPVGTVIRIALVICLYAAGLGGVWLVKEGQNRQHAFRRGKKAIRKQD